MSVCLLARDLLCFWFRYFYLRIVFLEMMATYCALLLAELAGAGRSESVGEVTRSIVTEHWMISFSTTRFSVD